MFITVYYGEHKSLLFNPSCSVVNLLNCIKRRCGYDNTDRVLDLTDETGLVLELNNHKKEYATKFLSSKGFYVLVEKLTVCSPSNDSNDSGLSQDSRYVSLLQRPRERFPNYNARVAERNSGQPQLSANRNTSRSKKTRVRQRKSFVEPT